MASEAFAPTPVVQVLRVEGGVVLLDLEREQFFALDDVGTMVWDMMADGLDLASISRAVSERYGVPLSQVSADVSTLVADLVDEGLAAEVVTG